LRHISISINKHQIAMT